MKRKVVFIYLIIIVVLTYTSYLLTHSFFSDVANSNSNLFAAASLFPTPSPTATPSPSSTPTPTPSSSPSPSPTTPPLSPGDVVFNEINWGGAAGDGNDQWVELKNTTGLSINIGSWVVHNLGGGGPNADITIPPGSSIPPNGFFLISHANQAGSKINVAPDFITTDTSLSNGGEQLTLLTNTSTLIDTANGTGAWFEGSGTNPKKSMERKTPPGDGTVSTNWQTATTHTNMDGSTSSDEFGTPKATNGL